MSRAPAKLRLLQSHRSLLQKNADSMIYPHDLKTAFDAAYDKAVPLVSKAVAQKFKPAEMDILEKFECATRSDSAKVLYPNGVVQLFNWRHTDDARKPKVPNANKYRYSEIYAVTQTTADAVEAWITAKDKFEKEYNARSAAYYALIQGANYLEDLLEVWPEAAALVPRTSGAIIAMGPEQIAAVKRDLEEQRARAHAEQNVA